MKYIKSIPAYIIVASLVVGCGEQKNKKNDKNPLLDVFDTQFGVPPFQDIKDEDFRPAFEQAMRQHDLEIDSIVNIADEPNFENTIIALEEAGQTLNQVSTVFFNLNAANTNENLQKIAKDIAPILSAHNDKTLLNSKLFQRVKTVYDQRQGLGFDLEDSKLLEEIFKSFVRSGANLSDENKEKLKKINSELSTLTTQFGQNALAETNAYELTIDNEKDLAGLPQAIRDAAAETANEKNKNGKWVFTLSNPSVMSFLQYAENRSLRKEIWNAYQLMGNNGSQSDNNKILIQIANYRLERAKLLGYDSHAAYVLEESMAANPKNVQKLLDQLWGPSISKAKKEETDIKNLIQSDGQTFDVMPYDWRYYAERIRKKKYAINEEDIKPYFGLKQVKEGAFETANKLYGLTFTQLSNIPVYHEDVEVYEVKDKDGSHLGVLYADFFPRKSKSSGAWMTSYRRQSTKSDKRIAPVISIVCNFTKPIGNTPSLLTFDEATTLFHEFGHALHGLLSNVRYQSLSGTSVPRDFVELPSQIMENWAADPQVLKSYAKHFETGEPIPDTLIEKIETANEYGQGFATTEYLAAAKLDLAYHSINSPIDIEAGQFENKAMQSIGLIESIIPRYRSTFFKHIFAGGYSAGYYSYIWSEILDKDAFAAFKSKGLYDQSTADAFRRYILERGGTEKPAEMYKAFRGAEPNPIYLLKKRGLNE